MRPVLALNCLLQIEHKPSKEESSIGDAYRTFLLVFATIICAYATTIALPDGVKDKLYDNLDSVISATPLSDTLILLSDFIVTVGKGVQRQDSIEENAGCL